MPKLPQVSGHQLAALLVSLGYIAVRQKGSHATYGKASKLGKHTITIPLHKEISKGTLHDVLTKVSLFNAISQDDLIRKLKKT